MNPLVFLVICGAGGVGSALRFVVDGVVRARFRAVFPFGTALINVTGSLVLGLLTGLVVAVALGGLWIGTSL